MSARNVALVFGLTLLQAAFIKDAHGQDATCDLMDLCFIVDRSGSICDSDQYFDYPRDNTCGNWASIINFIINLVSNMNIGPSNVRVALVIFANSAEVAWGLATYTDKTNLLMAINNLRYVKGGTTDTTGGLNVARTQVFNTADDRPNVQNVAIIITDGKPTITSTVPGAVAALQGGGCRTLVVGVTDSIDEDTLRMISSPPHQAGITYFYATNYSTISVVSNSLRTQTCPVSTTTVKPPTSCNVQDVVIVLDGSGSICDSDASFDFRRDFTCRNWELIRQFLHDIAANFTISSAATRVALIQFSDDARLEWGLDAYTDISTLLYAIDNLQYTKGGTTNMTGALKVLNSQVFAPQLTRPNVTKTAIIVTDGKPTDPSTVEAAVKAVNDSGIRCLVVGVTNQTDNRTLQLLASDPKKFGETYFIATDYQTVDDQVTAQLIAKACPPTLTSATTTTLAPTPPLTTRLKCYLTLDLAFVVDSSGSICGNTERTCDNWDTVRRFVNDIASAVYSFDLSEVRVGMIIFASEQSTRVLWNLTAYQTLDSLHSAINNLPYIGGNTDTIDALNLLRTSMFNQPDDRPNVKNTAIIVTDGNPQPYPGMQAIQAAIDAVHNANIKTIAVGITSEINETTLMQLASEPKINVTYFMAPDFDSLINSPYVNEVVDEICRT